MTMEGDIKKYETLLVINELSEIIKYHSAALDQLSALAESGQHPFTDGQIESLRNQLRDNQNILLREFNGLQRDGRTKKTYDKRYVCTKCHSVFMMPLPGGICDECRVKAIPNAYDRFKKSTPPPDAPAPTDTHESKADEAQPGESQPDEAQES